MAYTGFEDLDMEEQIEMLHKAVTELQERFRGHRHTLPGGAVAVSLSDMADADLEGKFVED